MAEHQEDRHAALTDTRGHHEGLGDQWAVLVGNPAQLMPQIVGTIIHSGSTRPSWQVTRNGKEYVMMAWPQEEPIRAAVVMSGVAEGDLKPATAVPLLDGLPNDLSVDHVHVWENGAAADVAVTMEGAEKPLWFYTPTYFRDLEALNTPGVTSTFLLAGLAYGMRRALLDTVTITQGPRYEAYAAAWLAEHPDKKSIHVPPLQLNVAGSRVIMPGNNYCEYQMRATIEAVDTSHLDKEPVYMVTLRFEMEQRAALDIVVYTPSRALEEGYVPKAGDEIDAYVWLQGRVMD
ncbi:MAG: hypothetical protein RRY29_09385 [Desulfovibrionaceae bacterium]